MAMELFFKTPYSKPLLVTAAPKQRLGSTMPFATMLLRFMATLAIGPLWFKST